MEELEGAWAVKEKPGPLEVEPLRRLLAELVGAPVEAASASGIAKLNSRVWRLSFETGRGASSVVVKRFAPEVARRNSMVLRRWLPAAGMSENGPVLLGAAAEARGSQVWHVDQDLGEWGLGGPAPEPERVAAAVETIAELHLRFADHPLLAECRLWGCELGMHSYTSNLRDAIRAVAFLEPGAVSTIPEDLVLRERLLDRLRKLLLDAPRRAKLLDEEGGPETLLHGDLWTKNVFVIRGRGGLAVKLIDWDHAGIGHSSYDLSTFLYRFPAEERASILEVYRRHTAAQGWRLPSPDALNVLAETAEVARIANRLIWPALALLRGEDWGWSQLREVERWFDALEPVLPDARAAP